MRPFNLEEAIQGKPLVTRDGRKILDFHYFKDVKELYPIIAVVDGESSIRSYTKIGRCFRSETESKTDLFMYEEPKTYYANVYRYSDDMIQISDGFLSKDNIIKNGGNSKNYVKTIEITI